MTIRVFTTRKQGLLGQGLIPRGLIVALTIVLSGFAGPGHARVRVTESVAGKDWRLQVRSLLEPLSLKGGRWYRFVVKWDDGAGNCRVSVCLTKSPGSGVRSEGHTSGLAAVASISISSTKSPGPSETVETRREAPPEKDAILARAFAGMRALLNRLDMVAVGIKRSGDRFYLFKKETTDEEGVRRSLAIADRRGYFKDVEGLVKQAFRSLRTRECPDTKDEDMIRVSVSSLPEKEGRGFRVEISTSPAECRIVTKSTRPAKTTIEVESESLDGPSKAKVRDFVGKTIERGRSESDTLLLLAGLPKKLEDLDGLEIFGSPPEPLSNLFLVRRTRTPSAQGPGQPSPTGCWDVNETSMIVRGFSGEGEGRCLLLELTGR